MAEPDPYDAVLVLSFGGPEGPDDVMPFLENVTRGRGVPAERLREVAKNYELFGGVSPINGQNRALIAALETELAANGPRLPIYFGNRNWHPFLEETVRQMAADGIRRALAFATSAYSSYSGCRQYRENIDRACDAVGSQAPVIDKLRAFWNHPGFIEPMVESVAAAVAEIPATNREKSQIVFTAHSLPMGMARSCDYELQLRNACELVMERLQNPLSWDLAYQSRSGPPSVPWLGPDIVERIEELAGSGTSHIVNAPIGFVSDHMEIVFDLDTQARGRAEELGVGFTRVPTVGTHPKFIAMIRELIQERMDPAVKPRSLGELGPRSSMCAPDCCPPPRRP